MYIEKTTSKSRRPEICSWRATCDPRDAFWPSLFYIIFMNDYKVFFVPLCRLVADVSGIRGSYVIISSVRYTRRGSSTNSENKTKLFLCKLLLKRNIFFRPIDITSEQTSAHNTLIDDLFSRSINRYHCTFYGRKNAGCEKILREFRKILKFTWSYCNDL